jgi:diguanylate cyclase (GGDEF)-like protein/PAS domain S-box-containing protein
MDDPRGALALIPDAAVLADARGVVVASNEPAAELFGTADLGGRILGELMPIVPAPAPGWHPAQARRINRTPLPVEASARELNGGTLLVSLRALRGATLISEAQRHFDAAFDRSPIGMALFNTDGEYVRVNAALCALLGRPSADLLGRRDQELTHPDDRQADLDAAWEILEGRLDTHQAEKRFVRPDGSVVWALASLTFLRDEEGRPLSWVGQFQDVTERRRQEAELRHLADHDPLTGLLNRRAFERALAQHVARVRRYGGEGAMLLIDLDGFKAVNDRHGHGTGDAVLTGAAERLRARLRTSDLLARLGGDEFAALLPAADRAGAEHVARVAVEVVRDLSPPTGPPVTASVGAAVIADPGTTVERVIEAADAAMYVAKRAGRDGFAIV